MSRLLFLSLLLVFSFVRSQETSLSMSPSASVSGFPSPASPSPSVTLVITAVEGFQMLPPLTHKVVYFYQADGHLIGMTHRLCADIHFGVDVMVDNQTLPYSSFTDDQKNIFVYQSEAKQRFDATTPIIVRLKPETPDFYTVSNAVEMIGTVWINQTDSKDLIVLRSETHEVICRFVTGPFQDLGVKTTVAITRILQIECHPVAFQAWLQRLSVSNQQILPLFGSLILLNSHFSSVKDVCSQADLYKTLLIASASSLGGLGVILMGLCLFLWKRLKAGPLGSIDTNVVAENRYSISLK